MIQLKYELIYNAMKESIFGYLSLYQIALLSGLPQRTVLMVINSKQYRLTFREVYTEVYKLKETPNLSPEDLAIPFLKVLQKDGPMSTLKPFVDALDGDYPLTKKIIYTLSTKKYFDKKKDSEGRIHIYCSQEGKTLLGLQEKE